MKKKSPATKSHPEYLFLFVFITLSILYAVAQMTFLKYQESSANETYLTACLVLIQLACLLGASPLFFDSRND